MKVLSDFVDARVWESWMRCDFMDAVCSCCLVCRVLSLMNRLCSKMLKGTVVHFAEFVMPQLRASLYIQRVCDGVGQGMGTLKDDEMPRTLAQGASSGSH
jgi:hypothetical protein